MSMMSTMTNMSTASNMSNMTNMSTMTNVGSQSSMLSNLSNDLINNSMANLALNKPPAQAEVSSNNLPPLPSLFGTPAQPAQQPTELAQAQPAQQLNMPNHFYNPALNSYQTFTPNNSFVNAITPQQQQLNQQQFQQQLQLQLQQQQQFYPQENLNKIGNFEVLPTNAAANFGSPVSATLPNSNQMVQSLIQQTISNHMNQQQQQQQNQPNTNFNLPNLESSNTFQAPQSHDHAAHGHSHDHGAHGHSHDH